jgi:hypothetical protein
MIALGVGHCEPHAVPRLADRKAGRGVRRQVRRHVLGRTTCKGHTHEVPDFVPLPIVQVIDVAPIGREDAKEYTFRTVRQLCQVAGQYIPGIQMVGARAIAHGQAGGRRVPGNGRPQDHRRPKPLLPGSRIVDAKLSGHRFPPLRLYPTALTR